MTTTTPEPRETEDDGSWLLVVGGFRNVGRVDDVGLVSLDPHNEPVPSCLKNLKAFPYPSNGAVGAVLTEGSFVD